MNKIKSITFFSAYYPPHTGGVERYVRSLSLHLVKKGVKVCVVTSNHDINENIIDDEGITVVRLPVRDLVNKRYPVIKNNKESKELKKYILTLDSDIFVSNMRIYHTTFLGRKLAKLKNKPHIIIEHVTGHFSVNKPALDFIGRQYEHLITTFVKKGTTAFYGVSEACCKWLGHFGIKAEGVIPNGVSENNYPFESIKKKLGIDDNKLVITYAGRLIEEKGLKLLINVFDQIAKSNDNSILVIAGTGELEEYIIQKSHTSGGRIIFAGKLEHSQSINLLRETDIVVNPSYYPEGLPTILLEAGLNKCSVIATDMGGTKELISNNETGILIEPKNESALHDALDKLINDSALRLILPGNIYQKVINEYLWENIADNFITEMNKYLA
jgi:glycosyltransferase involved in cell wall biosynthesis